MIEPLSFAARAMGGRLIVHLAADAADAERARRDAGRAMARMGRWADRLSRHLETSELSRLNASPAASIVVRPTLAAALLAGQAAGRATGGLVDVALLDARLAAEAPVTRSVAPSVPRTWSVTRGRHAGASVDRSPGLRFDLDGIAKGWLADRALRLLDPWTTAVVDADGDLAVRCASGHHWAIAIDDPRVAGTTLAILYLEAPDDAWPTRWGVATSGVSVHRWVDDGRVRHHIIDPRTGTPAVTDVVQVTVVSRSAVEAEGLAKAAVILGLADGFALLERAGVAGAVVLTDRGETLALPSTLALLDEPAAA